MKNIGLFDETYFFFAAIRTCKIRVKIGGIRSVPIA